MSDEIEMVEYSYFKDFVLVCSLGLNVGFILAVIFII